MDGGLVRIVTKPISRAVHDVWHCRPMRRYVYEVPAAMLNPWYTEEKAFADALFAVLPWGDKPK